VRLHEHILAPPRERDAAHKGLPAATGAAQIGEAGVLLGELGSEEGDVQELLVETGGTFGCWRLGRTDAGAGDYVRLRRVEKVLWRPAQARGLVQHCRAGASVMKEPSTTSLPSCRVKVASSVLTFRLIPGAEKKL